MNPIYSNEKVLIMQRFKASLLKMLRIPLKALQNCQAFHNSHVILFWCTSKNYFLVQYWITIVTLLLCYFGYSKGNSLLLICKKALDTYKSNEYEIIWQSSLRTGIKKVSLCISSWPIRESLKAKPPFKVTFLR